MFSPKVLLPRIIIRGEGICLLGKISAVLLTCWRPSLDVTCAVDHSILGFSFFHRAKAIPEKELT